MPQHKGACHCQAVRFTFEAPARLTAYRCNCSICLMQGMVQVIVPGARFDLTSGADQLSCYTFNTRVAQHTFCRICGVKPFYRPRSNPDGYGINIHCVDRQTIEAIDIEDFDGVHWEEHAAALAHLSRSDSQSSRR